jgi:hypothetical protein
MVLLPSQYFAKIRLSQFFPAEDIKPLKDWEYLNRKWVGEAVGFTEALCPKKQPSILKCLSLDLMAIDALTEKHFVEVLQLPLHRGMSENDVSAVLGQSRRVQQFVPQQKTIEFALCEEHKYTIYCTINENSGLKYLTILSVSA